MNIKYFNPDGSETIVEVPDGVDTVQINVETEVVTDESDVGWPMAAIVIVGFVVLGLSLFLD